MRIRPTTSATRRPSLQRVCVTLIAAAVVAAALGACSSDPLEEARSLHAEGRYLESLELLEAEIEARPDDPEAHFLYGVACVRSSRASLGLFSLRRAREFPGWEVAAGLELARAGLVSGDNLAAIDAATEVLAHAPDELVALGIRAEALARESRFEPALADAERVRGIDPNNGDIELLRLRLLVGLRRLDEARASFEEVESRRAAGELELPEGRYCAARAVFAAESQEPERAAALFEECIEQHPESAIVVEQALEFFDGRNDFARSQAILEQLIAEQPNRYPIREHLAARLRKSGAPDEAERLLREGTEVEAGPLAAMAWRGLAWHFFELGDFPAAADAWSSFMERTPNPGDKEVMAWSEALALAGRYDRALEVAGTLPEAFQYMARGRALLAQRRAGEALAAFENGLRLWPDNPVARYYAAIAAEHAGQFDRAVSEYRHSIRAGAGATDAGLRLGRLHFAERHYQQARIPLSLHQNEHKDDVEAAVLSYRVAVRLGDEAGSQGYLKKLSNMPYQRGRALAEAADTLAATSGGAVAIDFLLRTMETTDFRKLENADALRSLITQLARAGRGESAVMWARRAVDAHADAARAHELLGLALLESGAPAADAEASYAHALALDPDDPWTLRALAQLRAADREFDVALMIYDRAIEQAKRPGQASAIALEAARLALRERGEAAAEARLDALLWDDPINGPAAGMLAGLLLKRDDASPTGLAMAQRATRFGGRKRPAGDDPASASDEESEAAGTSEPG